MRKTFKRHDGTTVEVEGTPEELAEYERKIREGSQPASIGEKSKKKPVLRGAEVDGKPLTDEEVALVRLHRLGLLPKEEKKETKNPFTPMPWPIVVPDPWWSRQDRTCGFCGRINCHELHIWCTTATADKVSLLLQEDGSSKFSHTLGDVLAGRATLEVKTNDEHPYDRAVRLDEMYPKH